MGKREGDAERAKKAAPAVDDFDRLRAISTLVRLGLDVETYLGDVEPEPSVPGRKPKEPVAPTA